MSHPDVTSNFLECSTIESRPETTFRKAPLVLLANDWFFVDRFQNVKPRFPVLHPFQNDVRPIFQNLVYFLERHRYGEWQSDLGKLRVVMFDRIG